MSATDNRPPYCRVCGRDLFGPDVAAERERYAAEIATLRAKLADAIKGLDYACESPLAGCDCPGCSLARDESGAPAPMER